jgi:ribosomal protein S18 acetylase RimI-like enzyme
VELRELQPGESRLAHAAMVELGREVGSPEDFAARVDGELRPEGYRLIAVFEPGEEQAAAAAGFRARHDLVHGWHLFIDDLATRAAFRRRGHASAMLDWLKAEARRQRCLYLTLESGVNRHDAHRLYLRHGMDITSYHFKLRID